MISTQVNKYCFGYNMIKISTLIHFNTVQGHFHKQEIKCEV